MSDQTTASTPQAAAKGAPKPGEQALPPDVHIIFQLDALNRKAFYQNVVLTLLLLVVAGFVGYTVFAPGPAQPPAGMVE